MSLEQFHSNLGKFVEGLREIGDDLSNSSDRHAYEAGQKLTALCNNYSPAFNGYGYPSYPFDGGSHQMDFEQLDSLVAHFVHRIEELEHAIETSKIWDNPRSIAKHIIENDD